MSGSHRRRRRTGSTAHRYRSSDLVRTEPVRRPRRVGLAEWLACGAVAIVSALLVTLIWLVASRAIQDQRADVRDHVEQTLLADAALLAEQVSHELLLIDQSLTILQEAWQQDSDQVNLTEWQKRTPALTGVTDDLFIADENRIIRQDILPAAIGQGIGAAYVTFPHGSLESFDSTGTRNREGRLAIGQAAAPIDGRQFLMYIIRPLDHPKNWLIGASYRSTQLAKLFSEANLGINSLAALVDTRKGVLQAIVGPAARRPKIDATKSPLFDTIGRTDSGLWLGPTFVDGVERLTAFCHVPGRDVAVIVGVPWTQVLAPAEGPAQGYRTLAGVASLLVLIIGGCLLWGMYTLRSNVRRRRVFERGRIDLAAAQADLAAARAKASEAGQQLRCLVDGLTDGVAILDQDLALALWNPRFPAAARLDPGALKDGLPLDELLRRQAAAGAFGVLDNPEIEVAQRVSILRTHRENAELWQYGPGNETVAVQVRSIDDGGLLLILGGNEQWQPQAPEPHEDEAAPTASATIEW